MKLLLEHLRNVKNLFFIDFEGTQFTHEIIAIGCVKATIDENGNLLNYDKKGLKIYVKPRGIVGELVSKMTSLNDDFLKNNGVSFAKALAILKNYIGKDDYLLVTFGNNDRHMISETNRYQRPYNHDIVKDMMSHFFDFLSFMDKFIRDQNGNNYSLVNSLNLFNLKPHGVSHDPLNDAYDLMNLFFAFNNNKDIVFNHYLNRLITDKKIPDPIREIVFILKGGNSLSNQQFNQIIKEYLS